MHVSGLYFTRTTLPRRFSEAAWRVPPQSTLLASAISVLRSHPWTNLAATGEEEGKKKKKERARI